VAVVIKVYWIVYLRCYTITAVCDIAAFCTGIIDNSAVIGL